MNQTCFIRRTGRGRPVVFLGGCPTPWDVLAPIARAIASTHEAIELALPGFGESPALATPHTVSDVHAALEASLLAAGVRECAIVGFSGGAYHTLALASRGAVRVTHVLTLSGVLGLSPEEVAGFHGFAAALRAGQDLHPIAAPRFLSAAFAASHPEAVRAVEAWLDAAPVEVIASDLEAFAGAEDLTPKLQKLDAAVVARVGALDVATPPPRSEAIVKACPNARFELVEGAGHALVIEDLDGTIASLRRLLTR